MTKREQYGLEFINWIDPITKSNVKICRREGVNEYNELQIINRLNIFEIQSFIKDIENAQAGKYYDEIYSTDSIDDQLIEIQPPDIVINTICTIPLQDMKAILEEWLDFMQS